MIDIFIILIVVIVSWLFAYFQTHQVVYTKYLQFFVYQLYLNKAELFFFKLYFCGVNLYFGFCTYTATG